MSLSTSIVAINAQTLCGLRFDTRRSDGTGVVDQEQHHHSFSRS